MRFAVAFVTVGLVFSSIDSALSQAAAANAKPGRFLSLPVPAKCSSRKFSKIFATQFTLL